MKECRHDETESSDSNFETTYKRHEFSELVRLSLLAAAWLRRILTRPSAPAAVVVAASHCPSKTHADELDQIPSSFGGNDVSVAVSLVHDIAQQDVARSHATMSRNPPLFFGYVEFDADPDAPGGVPGFGQIPDRHADAGH